VRLIDSDAKTVEIRFLEPPLDKLENGLFFLFSGTDAPENLPQAKDRLVDIDEDAGCRIQNFRSIAVSSDDVLVFEPQERLSPVCRLGNRGLYPFQCRQCGV